MSIYLVFSLTYIHAFQRCEALRCLPLISLLWGADPKPCGRLDRIMSNQINTKLFHNRVNRIFIWIWYFRNKTFGKCLYVIEAKCVRYYCTTLVKIQMLVLEGSSTWRMVNWRVHIFGDIRKMENKQKIVFWGSWLYLLAWEIRLNF